MLTAPVCLFGVFGGNLKGVCGEEVSYILDERSRTCIPTTFAKIQRDVKHLARW